MPSWCTWSTLYKGIFALVIALILLEYFFGSIDNKNWDTRMNYNATRFPGTSKVAQLIHSPLLKLLNSVNTTIQKTQNTTSPTSSINPIEKSNSSNRNISSFINKVFDLNTTFSTELEISLENKLNVTTLPPCPEDPPDLQGRIPVIKNSVPKVYDLEKRFSWLKPGGHWYPDNCRVDKKVAIIIPFRCRGEHLLIFLQHMHPFLKKQQLDYTIFIIEQDGVGPFNRAMLMNVGFKEALKIRNFDCFIFHDVDLLPEDDRNLYTCPTQPRHMSVAIDVFRYKLPYRTIFGGVSAITREHFKILNGFSNSFWGWGGEDDDMSNRISYHNLHISRYPLTIARYTMLSHKKDKPSPNRYDILKAGQKKFNVEGLNSLKYIVKQMKENLLYTWILVSIESPS